MLQIWLLPNTAGVTPSYSQKRFPVATEPNFLHLLVSPDGRNESLTWAADAELYGARIDVGDKVEHAFNARQHGWVQVARGSGIVNGQRVEQGDGLALSEEPEISVQAGNDGIEFLFFELA